MSRFVAEGIVRLFSTRGDSKEFNKSFVGPGEFAGSLESRLSGHPSRLTMETVTECALLRARYDALATMYPRHAFWERLGRVTTETLYLLKARREAALLMDSASSRYEAVLREWGPLANSIPNYHIASHLGITPEALSRIRRARAKRSSS